MCHLITMILKPKKNEDLFREILERNGRKVSDALEKKYEKVVGPTELYWFAIKGMCDCGTALGSLTDGEVTSRLSLKEIEKLKKKGWSQTKIQRRIEEQEKINKRDVRVKSATDDTTGDHQADPDGWVSIIREILSSPNTFRVGLVKHWYSSGMTPDVLEKSNRVFTKFDDEIGAKLLRMEEDVCYEIGPTTCSQ